MQSVEKNRLFIISPIFFLPPCLISTCLLSISTKILQVNSHYQTNSNKFLLPLLATSSFKSGLDVLPRCSHNSSPTFPPPPSITVYVYLPLHRVSQGRKSDSDFPEVSDQVRVYPLISLMSKLVPFPSHQLGMASGEPLKG